MAVVEHRLAACDPTALIRGIAELLAYLLTYSMEQSPSLEANWFCS